MYFCVYREGGRERERERDGDAYTKANNRKNELEVMLPALDVSNPRWLTQICQSPEVSTGGVSIPELSRRTHPAARP